MANLVILHLFLVPASSTDPPFNTTLFYIYCGLYLTVIIGVPVVATVGAGGGGTPPSRRPILRRFTNYLSLFFLSLSESL